MVRWHISKICSICVRSSAIYEEFGKSDHSGLCECNLKLKSVIAGSVMDFGKNRFHTSKYSTK